MDNDPTMLVTFSDEGTPNNNSKERARELYDGLVKTIWIIKFSFTTKQTCDPNLGKKNSDQKSETKSICYCSGVCIGSKGYILTSKKGLRPLRSKHVIPESIYIYGRTHGSEYKELKDEVTSSDDTYILRVVDDSTMYRYVNPANDFGLVRAGTDLFVIGHHGDETFSYVNGHALAPVSTYQVIVANAGLLQDALPYPDKNTRFSVYIPIQAMYYVQHDQYLPSHQLTVSTNICGSAVFNLSGMLVGYITMGLQDITFATPFDGESLEKLEEYFCQRKQTSPLQDI